ncbi:hypothetical protein pb186bvf_018584 [Paramecium bursaria]
MSWDSYIDNLITGKGLEYAAIIGLDGNIWASNFGRATLESYQTPVPDPNNPDVHHNVAYDEKAALLAALANNGVSTHQAGLRVNHQKYYTVQFDKEEGAWFLKKEKGGAAIGITNTAIVFGSFSTAIQSDYGTPQNAAEANKRVLDMQKYLKDAGY